VVARLKILGLYNSETEKNQLTNQLLQTFVLMTRHVG